MPELPREIKEVGFDFDWDNRKVWALDLPIQEVDREFLEWHFQVHFLWSKPDGYYDLTPQQVMDDLDAYPEERERLAVADMAYAIDYMPWRGRPVILDGLHRLMKAHLENINPIKVREVPPGLKDRILKDKHA